MPAASSRVRGRSIRLVSCCYAPAAVESRPAQRGRQADRTFVTGALVFAVAGLEVAAVIGGVQQHRGLREVQAAHRVLQAAKRLVEPLHHAVVTGQVARGGTAERAQVGRRPGAGVALLVAGRRGVVVAVVLVVRLDERDEQEKRIGFTGTGVQVADGGVGERVDPVAGQVHRVAAAVEHARPVGVGGELQGVGRQPVAVAAALLRRHGPEPAVPRCHLPM